MRSFKKITLLAFAHGYTRKDPFVNYRITIQKTDRGFLTEVDLNKLINKEFKIERLEKVKDCFLFSCFTGLAHADLIKLKPEDISIASNDTKWVKINRQKTGELSSIPILPVAQQILNKYKDDPHCILTGKLLPVNSNQKMNAYLKEIADLCGIKQNLSSHLARHTFATTVTLNNDVPIETVSKMLGHTSIKMTKIYARLLDKKVENDMSQLMDKY